MKLYFLVIYAVVCPCLTADAVSYPCDYELSNRVFTNWNFKDVTWLSLSSKTICRSSFYNENPEVDIWPSTMTGVMFVDCNLDNVYDKIPPGNTVIGGSQRKFKVQNDGEDWILNPGNLSPVEPADKERFLKLGISTNPRNIPSDKMEEPITMRELRRKDMQESITRKQREIMDLEAELSR